MSKICGNCGTQLPDEARFCTECGGNVLEVRQAAGNDGGSFAGYNTSVVAGNGSLYTDQSAGHGETYADAGCYDEPAPKKKKIGLIVTIILTALLLGATAIALFVWPGFLAKKGIEGVWTNVRGGFALEFDDGKATVYTEDGNESAVFSYTQDGDKIKLDGGFEYEFKIKGNALTLYYEEDGQKYPEAYTSEGAVTPEERKVIGRWKVDDDELIIDDDTIIEIRDDEKDKQVNTYTYECDGCTFTVTPDDPDEAPFVHVFKVEDGELVIRDEDGATVIVVLSQDDGGTEFLKKATGGALAGRWIDEDGGPLRFENGEAITDSSLGKFAYKYAIDGDKLTLIDGGKVIEELTYTLNGGILTICRAFADGTETEYVFTRAETEPPEDTNDEIRVVEASHIIEDVPDYPGDPNAKREYSIPELRCSGENVAEFNRAIREECQSFIDYVNGSGNSGCLAKVEYSYTIYNGVVVISVSRLAAVAYSDVYDYSVKIYYFDCANDKIINDWKDYLSALGYRADIMEKAAMKTDRLIEFTAPNEYQEVWDLKLEGIIIGETESTVIVKYSYSDTLGSGTNTSSFTVPTSQLLKLYNDLKGNNGNSGGTSSSDFSGSDACYLNTVKSSNAYYCLKDINGDGVNELVLSESGDGIDALYTRVGQEVVELYLQGRHGGIGVTSDGYIYEQYKYVCMYSLQNGELVEVYSLDLDWDCDDPYEDLEKRSNEEREKRGISKTDMEFDYKKYL